MKPFFVYYIIAWSILCALGAVVALVKRRELEIFTVDYLRFLTERWKVVTFLIALTGICVMAPYSGDPTWDWIDAGFMAIFTFLSAPWVLGTIFRTIKGRGSLAKLYLALCLWLFSASWSYDLYILLRDGFYPPAWLSNIPASSVLYVSAGMLWSLDWRPGRGISLAFTNLDAWPRPNPESRFTRIVWIALPFMLIAAIGLGWFVYSEMGLGR